MNYFYLRGIDKIGPLTIEELKQVALTDDTLIWFDSLADWTKFSELPELKKELFGEQEITPPPIPQNIVEQQNQIIYKTEKQAIRSSNSKIIRISISIVIILLTTLTSFLFYSKAVNKDKQVLLDKIDLIFQGKTTVCDGLNYRVEGTLSKLSKPIFCEMYVDKNVKTTDEFKEMARAQDSVLYDMKLKEYVSKKDLGIVEEFTLKSGGFSVYKITKEDNGFVVEKTDAKDMFYKISDYDFTHGYSKPTGRPSVENCYISSLRYLTIDNKDGSYTPNIFSKIENFSELRSDFFIIQNLNKPTSPYTNHWVFDDGDRIQTNQYAINIKKDCKYFEIVRDEKEITNVLIVHIVIGLVVGMLLIVIFNFGFLKLKRNK